MRTLHKIYINIKIIIVILFYKTPLFILKTIFVNTPRFIVNNNFFNNRPSPSWSFFNIKNYLINQFNELQIFLKYIITCLASPTRFNLKKFLNLLFSYRNNLFYRILQFMFKFLISILFFSYLSLIFDINIKDYYLYSFSFITSYFSIIYNLIREHIPVIKDEIKNFNLNINSLPSQQIEDKVETTENEIIEEDTKFLEIKSEIRKEETMSNNNLENKIKNEENQSNNKNFFDNPWVKYGIYITIVVFSGGVIYYFWEDISHFLGFGDNNQPGPSSSPMVDKIVDPIEGEANFKANIEYINSLKESINDTNLESNNIAFLENYKQLITERYKNNFNTNLNLPEDIVSKYKTITPDLNTNSPISTSPIDNSVSSLNNVNKVEGSSLNCSIQQLQVPVASHTPSLPANVANTANVDNTILNPKAEDFNKVLTNSNNVNNLPNLFYKKLINSIIKFIFRS